MMPMWKPPPPSRPPPYSGQLRSSVSVQLDDMILNDEMRLRGIPYNETTTRTQNIIQIFRHDFEQVLPRTQQPVNIPRT